MKGVLVAQFRQAQQAMYFALFERLHQLRERGVPMRFQFTYCIVSTLSQNNFDNSSVMRAIHTLLRRSLDHALLLKAV
ncbi:hypothetical protein ABB33_00520 [Stenotrophomonas acidaminiphila]|jgi:hypothetical protein|nr:hypothetical protein ABB33_00520 [Stenotrophomonas acidaminiphila]